MPYTLTDYWNDLDNALLKFDIDNHVLIDSQTSEEDDAAYILQRDTLTKMRELGRQLDEALWPGTKISLGNQMDHLPIESYGDAQIPFIKGPKSLALAQQVYLPHLQRFAYVEFHSFIIQLSKYIGTDLELKMRDTAAIVEKFQEYINRFNKNHFTSDAENSGQQEYAAQNRYR